MTALCRFCHAHTKCTVVGHLYVEKGPCSRCGKNIECVNCDIRNQETIKALIKMYRNTKEVDYDGGFK